MTQFLQPGSVPAWSGDTSAPEIDNVWADEMWPALWPRMIHAYANAAARDAELAGLAPTDVVFAYLRDTKQLTYWSGTAWLYLSATSATKAGKRTHWGQASMNTDASGFGIVTHGAGFTPTAVVCNLRATSGNLYDVTRVGNFTATTFTVRVLDGAGAAIGAVTGIPISHFCGE